MGNIQIRNARTHNLKNIDIDIPKGKLIVVTGVSGSGKSSLIYDTLYQEGRNLYLSFIGQSNEIAQWKTVDSIRGLSPIIAVEQKVLRFSNPRSTVGTKTSLNALLRSLYISDGAKPCEKCSSFVRLGHVCPSCSTRQSTLHISMLNANSLNGICHRCMGRGSVFQPLISKLLPNQDIEINILLNGWLKQWGLCNNIELFYRLYDVTGESRLNELPEEALNSFIYGISDSGRDFIGLLRAAKNYERFKINQGSAYEYQLKKMGEMIVCDACDGFRLCSEALEVTIAGYHIGEMSNLSMEQLEQLMDQLYEGFELSSEGKQIVKNIKRFTQYFTNVGLSYLSANRPLMTLSGGEAQRLMLMSHLQSKLDSVVYIFDEPTAGLHESEKERLIDQLYQLKEQGNSVIVVEHDKRVIQRAEHVIDIGPFAGKNGGHVIYNGEVESFSNNSESMTSRYLVKKPSHLNEIDNTRKRLIGNAPKLRIIDAWTNNLKGITVDIPLGVMVGIAGVSGSGKSSMISHTLVPLLKSWFHNGNQLSIDSEEDEDNYNQMQLINGMAQLEGAEQLQGFTEVTQQPIGRLVTSVPLTYLKVWDRVRKLFASLPEAKEKGLSASSFSFNTEGACLGCEGRGFVSHRVGDRELESICPECQGSRYDNEILEVKYKGCSIANVLDMSASEGAIFFNDIIAISHPLKVLDQTGMGYIRMGQPTQTLSGGEAQRLKLVKELGRKRKGTSLYILDEPTTGLSMHDTINIMHIFRQLIHQGHSLIICEHDTEVLSNCDWIIELGPFGGNNGGNIIAEGSPKDLLSNPNSKLGPFLIDIAKRS